jgi:poly-gamma-glutamate capsule biosynthesis protein CapA/YwtB (metallophosphatase superfamily)
MSSEKNLKILAVGDISFKGRWDSIPTTIPFQHIIKHFEQNNFVIANLESPLVSDTVNSISGKCTLQGDLGWAKILCDCGISLVSLANNHLMDFGEQGLNNTIEALQSAGILYVGAGQDAKSACAPVFKDLSGNKLAFLARSAVEVSSLCYAGPEQPGVALLDENELVSAIKKCKETADLVIVMLHWGIEHYHYPTPQQRRLAKTLVSAGADIILGHHPHVLQGEEQIGNALVSYSSGNFLFDEFPWSYLTSDGQENKTQLTLTPANRQGMMLEVKIADNSRMTTKQIFTRISSDAIVEIDDSPARQSDYQKLCNRLHIQFYDTFWKSYSLKREWDLRLKNLYSPRMILKKIHKLRPRHFKELVVKIKRSSRISSGKSTNPYE